MSGPLGLAINRHRARGLGVPVAPPPPPPPPLPPVAPTGFAANGSTNAALKAMLARVAAGTGGGRIVFKGDSTTAGAGGGDPASVQQLGGARANRTSAVLAARLAATGYPAQDGAVIGDNGAKDYVPLPTYDPRVALGGGWVVEGGQAFAGGNYLYVAGGSGALDLTPAEPVDRFEVVVFNVGGTYSFLIDGAAPVSVAAPGASVAGGVVAPPSTGAGLTRITLAAASAGVHTLRVTSSAVAVLRSVRGWASGVATIDILNHASNGATSANQAVAANGWSNNDSLAFDAPDLTIVNLGLNDTANQVGTAAYAANLQTIVATARQSGDVLLVFPHPAGAQFAVNPGAYRDAAAALAATNGIAFLSLFDHYGGVFTPALQARMADGLVHGNAGFYAEVGELYRQCLDVMAAA